MRVAAISRDQNARLELARAFDAAPSDWRIALHTDVPSGADIVVFGPDVDAGDGLSFDPENPDDLIPAVEAVLAERASSNLFVVTGTGGGVGVTSVALHLALHAARSRKTCCVGGSDIGLRLDLPPEIPSRRNGSEIDLLAVPVAGGFRVVLTADATEVAEAARERFETVILDASSHDENLLAAARATLLVCPPTVPAARRARELIRRYPDVRWAVVTNRAGPGGEMTRVALEQILGCRIAVELPTCAPLRDTEDDGRLLDSRLYRWPRRVARLWAALERA